ncbi:MAG TPA: TIGR03086 family metal-binding protein [Streptosporangiaceae bacterium]|nr:TIGR03086 family metal-binding protein [Streptosporangiaceae bacterium]
MLANDLIATFLAAQRAFSDRVHAVSGDQWTLPTPDREWTVADLVWHLVEEHRWAAPLLSGVDMDAAGAVVADLYPAGPGRGGAGEGDTGKCSPGPGGPGQRDSAPAGPGLVRDWDIAATRSADAFRAYGALAGSVHIGRGRAPAPEYLAEMNLDLVVHAWDLGTAIGYPDPLPGDAVAAVYPGARAIVDRTPAGMFAAPVEVPADAPVLDRLLALTGRTRG